MSLRAPPSLRISLQPSARLISEGLALARAGCRIEDDYELGQEIGRGTNSTVLLGRHRRSQQLLAIKVVDKMRVARREQLRDEVVILTRIQHPNVITLYELFESDRYLFLVMELAYGGELFDRLAERGSYSEREAAEVATQLISAVAYLHASNIVHRDIKPENILLASCDSDTHVKLSDFGLAKLFEDESVASPERASPSPPPPSRRRSRAGSIMDVSMALSPVAEDASAAAPVFSPAAPAPARHPRARAYTTCGTDLYTAPEVLSPEAGYDAKADMWSLGVVLYIMLCGFPPFYTEDGNMDRVYRSIQAGDFSFPDPDWSTISDAAKDLVRRLLDVCPETRLSAKQALAHPWIQGRAEAANALPLPADCISNIRRFNRARKMSVG